MKSCLHRTDCYFWSSNNNGFIFGHGPLSSTLMDVYMLTSLDITLSANPSILNFTTSHRFKTKGIGGWKKYINEYKGDGPVIDREHTAFLMMWLEHFFFCDTTLGPTTNLQNVTEALAQGSLSKWANISLVPCTWCFIKHRPSWYWPSLLAISTPLMVCPRLAPFIYQPGYWHRPSSRVSFPADYTEEEPLATRRCVSLGEAALTTPGYRLSDHVFGLCFTIFYRGLTGYLLCFPYSNMDNFVHLITFGTIPRSTTTYQKLSSKDE